MNFDLKLGFVVEFLSKIDLMSNFDQKSFRMLNIDKKNYYKIQFSSEIISMSNFEQKKIRYRILIRTSFNVQF